MMSDLSNYTPIIENVYPETLPNLYQAHCLINRRWEDRIVQHNSVGELLNFRYIHTPDKNWLTFYEDSQRTTAYTYAEFYDAVCRAAAYMQQELALQQGDRIATLMMNDPRTVIIYFASWFLGITVVPINIGEDDERVSYILSNSQAKAVFVMNSQCQRCDSLRKNLPHLHHFIQVEPPINSNYINFDDLITCKVTVNIPETVNLETEALIVYTSGTTGAPKGVVLDHYNLLADAHSIAEWHRFGQEDRAMCVLPIHHVNGTIVTLVTPLYSGGSVVLNRRVSVQSFWHNLAAEKCTWVSVVPTVLAFLCDKHEDLSQYDLSSFKHFICGAGPLTIDNVRRFEETFGLRIVHGYGLSETTCYSCFLPIDLDKQAYRHWMMECGFPSIGCPISANEMAIHDAQGNPLPPDTRGEIVIRGHNVMKYYFQRPDANRDTFAHGWFRSGDEGFFRISTDGLQYFFITGRIKELIIRGGVNYSPFDIDEVLNAIPGVKAAMAVGFENNYYGEEVGAYVQKEEGVTLTEEDLIKACRLELPFSKSPKVVLFGDTFPVTSTGKYQRNKLKPLFEQWKDTQFRDKG